MRVLIVDDQRIVREGLATIVDGFAECDVVGLAANGVEAVDLVADLAPDVVLMDLRMPGMDGVDATREIRSQSPTTQVVVLTTYADDESVLSALSSGAAGYLTKDAARADIRRALEAAVAGQAVFDSSVHATLLRAARQAPTHPDTPPDGLTDREAEVLSLIAGGCRTTKLPNGCSWLRRRSRPM